MHDWETKGKTSIVRRRVENFRDELRRQVMRDQLPFQAKVAVSADPLPLGESLGLERRPVAEGEVWGRDWDSGYFLLRTAVPEAWAGRPLAAWIDLGGESLVYSPDGEPLYGLTNGSAFALHYAKDVYRLEGPRRSGDSIELLVEAAASGLFGLELASDPAFTAEPGRHGSRTARISKMRLCTFDAETWALALDVDFLLELWADLDEKSVRASRILRALFRAACTHRGDPGNVAACRALLAPELAKRADASALSTTVVGHAHIDTAWLWRLGETRRKVARTFASQLDLIEKYPGYVFGASSPQHYAWLKEDHPATYRRVKEAVREGRWEPQGGMWVEADCNLVSGESLIRQCLHGQAFWRREFGIQARSCWIPDVFGYPASLPQILKKCGMDYFLTQKLSWSKLDEFPHDSFRWRGLDGSEILTHFPPEYTYNSYCRPRDLRKAEAIFHEKDFLDEFVTLMGIGDGGGGPKEEHLEHVMRARNCEGLPKAAFGSSTGLFERLEAHREELEVWTGELYLEYHRGTYTSQARIKRDNRKLEEELRAAEALSACLPLSAWPAAELDRVVKTLLLHQFHDIIPGSSIAAVYAEARPAYAEAFAALESIENRAAAALCPEDPDCLTFFNCLSEPYEEVLELPPGFGEALLDGGGKAVEVQTDPWGAVAAIRIPALGFSGYRRSAGKAKAAKVLAEAQVSELILENELVLYRFDLDGSLVEAFDKERGRSLLKPGERGNLLSFYEDTPHEFEAWDIDFYYPLQLIETARSRKPPLRFSGPLRSGLGFELAVGSSAIHQEVILTSRSKALTFRTLVEWRESRRMLRVTFPLATSALEGSCDIQFGHIGRPTHANTSWDEAKFEVCAHRYVDLSDPDWGVALFNDCKYGHSLRDNVLGLTLLRSPHYPDPDADRDRHELSYALYPHLGGLLDSEVMEGAEAFNRPPLVFLGREPGPAAKAPIALAGKGLSLVALKKSEEGESLVARIVEKRGSTCRGRLSCAKEGKSIQETDLLEQELLGSPRLPAPLEIELKPFEIRTFLIS